MTHEHDRTADLTSRPNRLTPAPSGTEGVPERRVRRRGRPAVRYATSSLIAFTLLLIATIASADLPQIAIEAEDYSQVTGGTIRVLDRPEASGGKCVSYWEEPGVAVTCEFEVAEAGEYCLTLGYALNWPDTRREVRVDGEVIPGLEDVLLPGTGTWADFRAITLAPPEGRRVRIPLQPGPHTLTLTNVDSRGLAWDYAVFHDPATLLADVPLSDEELAEFGALLPATARRLLLEGPAEGDLALGDVALAFSGGMPQAARVGDAFFAVPRDMPAPIVWQRHRVGPLAVATFGAAPEPAHARAVFATDGTDLVLLMAGTAQSMGEGAGAPTFPAPLIVWRDGRPWRLALQPIADALAAGEIARTLQLDGLTISVNDLLSGKLNVGAVPWLQLGVTPLISGDLHVAAVKVGPAMPPADTRIEVHTYGEDVVVRSSADMPPALASFYGIPRFEVRVHPDVSMTITTDAGETLELPAP